MADQTFIVNDTQPSISATLTSNGSAVDLTGATVTFEMVGLPSGRPIVTGAAVIVDDAGGQVRYDWGSTDLAVAGSYSARWKIEFSDGTIEHSDPANTITVTYP